jgi:hypothetical protein
MNMHAIRISCVFGFLCLSFATTSGISCTQPDIHCVTGTKPYAVQYFPKETNDDCLMLAGELIGLDVYNPPLGYDLEIDASRATLAIQAASVGALADDAFKVANARDPNTDHKQYALGNYAIHPDANDICIASEMSDAIQHIPQTAYTTADGGEAIYPETRLIYAWRDVRVHVTFATPGNAMTGEVTITRETTDPQTGMQSACQTTYVASALFPSVACEAKDEMGNPNGMPDDTLCCANADPEHGRPLGSGLHPSIRVKCHPELLQCVLDWRPGETFPPLGANAFCREPT